MENQEKTPKQEIENLEQFQVSRAPLEEKQTAETGDSEYTPGETEFADGEGTELNDTIQGEDLQEDEILGPEDEEDDKDAEQDDDTLIDDDKDLSYEDDDDEEEK